MPVIGWQQNNNQGNYRVDKVSDGILTILAQFQLKMTKENDRMELITILSLATALTGIIYVADKWANPHKLIRNHCQDGPGARLCDAFDRMSSVDQNFSPYQVARQTGLSFFKVRAAMVGKAELEGCEIYKIAQLLNVRHQFLSTGEGDWQDETQQWKAASNRTTIIYKKDQTDEDMRSLLSLHKQQLEVISDKG